MRRFCIGLLYAIAAYAFVGTASYFLVMQLSGNTHDREVEAAMTSVFFFGPLGGDHRIHCRGGSRWSASRNAYG